jgi:hypothetical protein
VYCLFRFSGLTFAAMDMQDANLIINADELELIKDADLIRRKISALGKISACFGSLQGEIEKEIHGFPYLPEEAVQNNFKISRGEKYREMPYLVMDYPACFGRRDIFACRTMFLWGHEFSFTLHLSGSYLRDAGPALLHNEGELAGKEFFACVNSNPFEYHFGADNYRPLESLSGGEEGWGAKGFVKLSRRLSLDRHKEIVEYGLETYLLLFRAMSR